MDDADDSSFGLPDTDLEVIVEPDYDAMDIDGHGQLGVDHMAPANHNDGFNLDSDMPFFDALATNADLFERHDHQFGTDAPAEQAYAFRPGDRYQPADAYCAYLDNDETGDYDPATEFRRPRHVGRRVGVQLADDEAAYNALVRDSEARARRLTKLAARVNEGSLVFTFYTGNYDVAQLAEKFTDHWASEIPSFEDNVPGARRAPPEGDATLHYPHIADPAGIELDLQHHPAARGCVGCRTLNIPCSLLGHKHKGKHPWPCTHCAQDGMFCELITPPIRKITCEPCKHKKLKCSYYWDPDSNHQLPCQQCTQAGDVCVAGPAEGGIRDRASYDKDYSKKSKPKRKFLHCTACRKGKHQCSLKTKRDPVPCERCKADGSDCTFWYLPSERKKSTALNKGDTRDHLTKPKQTALIHPIDFLEDAYPCSWCTKQNYGLIGKDGIWRQAILHPEDNTETRYKEVRADADRAFQSQCSRMCSMCTMKRIQIASMCSCHEIVQIPGLVKDIFDCDEGTEIQELQIDFAAMYSRMNANRQHDTDEWCSLCVTPAFYRCNAFQEANIWGEVNNEGDPESQGCGLQLCFSCYEEYLTQNGDLAGVLAVIRKEWNGHGVKGRWPFGMRADAGLLMESGSFEDGLLVRCVEARAEGGVQ